MGSTIEVTIKKTATAGKGEIAKTYITAFEGEMSDLKTLQEGVDRVVDNILFSKKEVTIEEASV